GSRDGHAGGVADHNQTTAVVEDNTVEGSTIRGIELYAGDSGLASANTTEVEVTQNTVCHNTGDDIHAEGGAPGGIVLGEVFAPNQGSGNVLAGEISKNTATTVTVANGTPGNTTTVT